MECRNQATLEGGRPVICLVWPLAFVLNIYLSLLTVDFLSVLWIKFVVLTFFFLLEKGYIHRNLIGLSFATRSDVFQGSHVGFLVCLYLVPVCWSLALLVEHSHPVSCLHPCSFWCTDRWDISLLFVFVMTHEIRYQIRWVIQWS